jgi:intracellular septation protein
MQLAFDECIPESPLRAACGPPSKASPTTCATAPTRPEARPRPPLDEIPLRPVPDHPVFRAYKFAGIFAATAVAIAATVGQIAWVWFRHRKVDTMLWVSLAIVTIFGGATLLFQNPTFIKWKPTVLYWFFAARAAGVGLRAAKNLIRTMLEAQMKLPEALWGRLNLAWAGFFAVMGVLNLLVAYNFSEETWVNFKLFGGMGLMLVFVLAQGMLLSRYIEEEPK